MSDIIGGVLIGCVICVMIYVLYRQNQTVNKIQHELRTDGKTEMRTKDDFNIGVLFHDTDCVAVIVRKVGDRYEITSTQKSTEKKVK